MAKLAEISMKMCCEISQNQSFKVHICLGYSLQQFLKVVWPENLKNCVVNSVKMLKIDQSLEVPIFLECPHQLFVKVNWSEMLTNCDVKSSKMLTNLQNQSFQVSPWSGRLPLEAFLNLIWLEKIQNCVVKSPKSSKNQSFHVNFHPGVTYNSVKNILSDILLLCKTWKYG